MPEKQNLEEPRLQIAKLEAEKQFQAMEARARGNPNTDIWMIEHRDWLSEKGLIPAWQQNTAPVVREKDKVGATLNIFPLATTPVPVIEETIAQWGRRYGHLMDKKIRARECVEGGVEAVSVQISILANDLEEAAAAHAHLIVVFKEKGIPIL